MSIRSKKYSNFSDKAVCSPISTTTSVFWAFAIPAPVRKATDKKIVLTVFFIIILTFTALINAPEIKTTFGRSPPDKHYSPSPSQNRRIAELQNCRIAELQNRRIAESQNRRIKPKTPRVGLEERSRAASD